MTGAGDGWDVTEADDGLWVAVRHGTLSTAQAQYGCRTCVDAESCAGLLLAITVENIKAAMIKTAEDMARRVIAAELERQDGSGDEHRADTGGDVADSRR